VKQGPRRRSAGKGRSWSGSGQAGRSRPGYICKLRRFKCGGLATLSTEIVQGRPFRKVPAGHWDMRSNTRACRRGRVPSGDESTLGKLPGLCHVSSPILTDCQAPFKYRHHCPEQDGRGSGHDMSPQRLHSPERICGVQRLLGISGLTCFQVCAAAGPSK